MLAEPHSLVTALATVALVFAAVASHASPTEWISLFDGRSLMGWRAGENPGTFRVRNGEIVAHGPRAHLFFVGDANTPADFRNFELEAEALSKPGANSGVFFHTAFQQDGWPDQGYEVQIDNSEPEHDGYLERKLTGSLYGVRNIHMQVVRDDEWFGVRISVRSRHVQVRLNDTLVVDYVEPDMPGESRHQRLSHGTFALQGHDAGSEVHFRNLRVRRLPDDLVDDAKPAPFDAVAQTILKLAGDNFPLIDFHTHLKGGLTLDQTLEHMRQTGINHGIAVNGGVGFPITDDAGIERFRQSMKGAPCFIGLQAEGREWPTLFSKEAIAKFDYVFTDAMTIVDHRGKRARLWIKEEVDIPDKQAFMDHLVDTIVGILDNEPVDIYANPTYLPDVIASEYDALWTPARMDRVISAAVRNGVAIEIASRLRIPSLAFLKRAKAAGVKFSLGTNNADPDLGRLEYALQMVEALGLAWKDMWMPRPDGQKPVQVGRAHHDRALPQHP